MVKNLIVILGLIFGINIFLLPYSNLYVEAIEKHTIATSKEIERIKEIENKKVDNLRSQIDSIMGDIKEIDLNLKEKLEQQK